MVRQATQDQINDHERDLRKHEWRPGDPLPLDQRCAVAQLIGYCEGLISSGLLEGELEIKMRRNVASVLTAFNMPSAREKSHA